MKKEAFHLGDKEEIKWLQKELKKKLHKGQARPQAEAVTTKKSPTGTTELR